MFGECTRNNAFDYPARIYHKTKTSRNMMLFQTWCFIAKNILLMCAPPKIHQRWPSVRPLVTSSMMFKVLSSCLNDLFFSEICLYFIKIVSVHSWSGWMQYIQMPQSSFSPRNVSFCYRYPRAHSGYKGCSSLLLNPYFTSSILSLISS